MASKKFFVDIDLNNNYLKNSLLGTSDNLTTTEGAFGYESGFFKYRDNSSTQIIASQTYADSASPFVKSAYNNASFKAESFQLSGYTVVLTNGSANMTSANGAFGNLPGKWFSPASYYEFWVKDGSNNYFVSIDNITDDNTAAISDIYSDYYNTYVSSVWTGPTGTYNIYYNLDESNEGFTNVNTGTRTLVNGSEINNIGDNNFINGIDIINNVASNSLLTGRRIRFTGTGIIDSSLVLSNSTSNISLSTYNEIREAILVGSQTKPMKYYFNKGMMIGNAITADGGGALIGGVINAHGTGYKFSFGEYVTMGYQYRSATTTTNTITISGGDYTSEYAGTNEADIRTDLLISGTSILSVVFSSGNTVITANTTLAPGLQNTTVWVIPRRGGTNYSVAIGQGINTKEIKTGADNSYILSRNTSAQTVGHGVLSQDSIILGGINHNIPGTSPRSAILGGNAIKARANEADQVYVPNLNIVSAPAVGSDTDQVLVRNNTTGKIYYVNQSTLANSGTAGQFTASNGLTKIGNNVSLGGSLVNSETYIGTSTTFGILLDKDGNVFDVNASVLYSGNIDTFTNLSFVSATDNFVTLRSTNDANSNTVVSVQSDTGRSQYYVSTTFQGNQIQFVQRAGVDSSSHYMNILSTGTANFEGLTYGADYSPFYTNRSLVDKEFVLSQIGYAGTAATVNVSNGLSKSGDNIILGGTLTQSSTQINGSGGTQSLYIGGEYDETKALNEFGVTVKEAGGYLHFGVGDYVTYVDMTDTSIDLYSNGNTTISSLDATLSLGSNGSISLTGTSFSINAPNNGEAVISHGAEGSNLIFEKLATTTAGDLVIRTNSFDDNDIIIQPAYNAGYGITSQNIRLINNTNGNISHEAYGNLYLSNSQAGTTLRFSPTDVTFEDIRTNAGNPDMRGIEYFADYSATYTNRSLVDKEFVLNQITIAGTAGNVSSSKYATTITGDGVITDFTVTHNLSTYDVLVQVFNNTSPRATVETTIERNSTSSIDVIFNVAPGNGVEYRVLVMMV